MSAGAAAAPALAKAAPQKSDAAKNSDKSSTTQPQPINPLWQNFAMGAHSGAMSSAAGAEAPPPSSSIGHVPRLHHQSNSALLVQRLCSECDQEQNFELNAVQPKLSIGAPNDPYEQEADAVAAAVTSGDKVQRISSTASTVSRSTPSKSGNAGTTSGNLSSRIALGSGGRPLSTPLRDEMESAIGADFSNVRIHDSPQDQSDAASIGAHAFTHKSGIWLGPGSSADDRKLMAHELTHVVQQGAAVRRKPVEEATATAPQVQRSGAATTHDDLLPEEEQDANIQPSAMDIGQSKIGTPDVQAAWYNVSIPFTDYEFDPSIDGLKTAAGLAGDAVVDGATWVKDRVVDAFQWVYDQICDLVNSGKEWLEGQFAKIEAFAASAFDTIKKSFSALVSGVTSPADMLMSAFRTMDETLINTAWGAMASGAALLFSGIKTSIDTVLAVGVGLWDAASEFIDSLFGTVNSIINSWPFRQLPDFLQRGARTVFDGLRNFWNTVRDFTTKFLKELREFIDDILTAVQGFLDRIKNFSIQDVIDTVKKIRAAWEFVQQVADDPEGFIRPIIDDIVGKLNSEAPGKAVEVGQEKLAESDAGGSSSSGAAVRVQRQHDGEERSTATRDEVEQGFIAAISTAWGQLDLAKMLWDTVVNMFWPPATIRAIGHEFSELWNNDWANAANGLFAPRAPWDDFVGFFHDIWSNFLVLLDFPLALWRRLNSVLMLLMGYVTIILVIYGAVAGGIAGAAAGGVGAVPGAVAGALAGLELAGAIGMVLLASYFFAESITVLKAFLDLYTARQTQTEKNRDYVQIAGSLIGMAIAIVLVVIMWLLAEFIGAVVSAIKGGAAPPVVEVRPPETAPPEVRPVAGGEPVAPAEPAVAPAEGGAPTEVRPPTEDVAPPTEEPTPPSEEVSPPSEEVSPPVEEPSPPAEEVSPPAEEPAPPTEEPAPPTEEPAPPVEEPNPPAAEPEPPAEETAPPAHEPGAPTDEVTPPTEDLRPPVEEGTLPPEEAPAPAEEANPPAEEAQPPGEEGAPPEEETVTPAEEEAAELSGRRPPRPDRPVLDSEGNLTEYGEWYYERPGGYRARTRGEVWDDAVDTDGVVRDPVSEEPISSDSWRMEERPGHDFASRQRAAAERGAGREEFLDDYNSPEHYQPRSPRTPASEFSGPRPALPERPVLDAQNALTDYGRWYYERPSGYRAGVRDTVWEQARTRASAGGGDGVVRDPLTERPMSPDEPWDMGHRPGYEFRSHRLDAARRGISRETFLDEHNVPEHYRPELPESNRSHLGEATDGVYLGSESPAPTTGPAGGG